jgi:hypothetical protein
MAELNNKSLSTLPPWDDLLHFSQKFLPPGLALLLMYSSLAKLVLDSLFIGLSRLRYAHPERLEGNQRFLRQQILDWL